MQFFTYFSPLFAAIGPSIEESGSKHPVWILFIIGLIIIVGGILGYIGLKKRLNEHHFIHNPKSHP